MQLFEYAFCNKWGSKLEQLEQLANNDRWNYKSESDDRKTTRAEAIAQVKENDKAKSVDPLKTGEKIEDINKKFDRPILDNYIKFTFLKLQEEYDNAEASDKNNIIYESSNHSCFDTGLFTKGYERIFALFGKNSYPSAKNNWFLIGFFPEGNRSLATISLPRRANYFDNPADLIFDYRLPIRLQLIHILDDDTENYNRIPEKIRQGNTKSFIQQLFVGAIENTKKKLTANYKIAIPQYYQNTVQLLAPLDLTCDGNVDLALAMTKTKTDTGELYYAAHTCLTLEMAYNNARLIVKPESEWLNLDKI